MKWLSFGIIIDNKASPSAERVALDLHEVLQGRGANECFYINPPTDKTPPPNTFKKMLENHVHDTDVLGAFREMSTEPKRGQRIELPDLARAGEGDADSVLVEDTLHCSPAMALDYPESEPSLLQARQNKRREMVMFDHQTTYSEYALLVYEYESAEAMAANLDKEYPRNPHGVPQPCDPLHFLTQRFGPGGSDAPLESVPPPDPTPLVCIPTSPGRTRSPLKPQTPPAGPAPLGVLGESTMAQQIGDKFIFDQF